MHLKFGRLNTVIVTSPEAAREVLKTHDQTLSSRTSPNSIRSINHQNISVAWIHPSTARWRYNLLSILFLWGFVYFLSSFATKIWIVSIKGIYLRLFLQRHTEKKMFFFLPFVITFTVISKVHTEIL